MLRLDVALFLGQLLHVTWETQHAAYMQQRSARLRPQLPPLDLRLRDTSGLVRTTFTSSCVYPLTGLSKLIPCSLTCGLTGNPTTKLKRTLKPEPPKAQRTLATLRLLASYPLRNPPGPGARPWVSGRTRLSASSSS